MEYIIERARLGDEGTLAFIQTESWKAGFKDILPPETLERYTTQLDKATAMYRRMLERNVEYGYLLKVEGEPHCIAVWSATRETDMPGYAELICIHSLQSRWRKGYGTKMMERVLADIAQAGYEKVMLWVFEENARARGFYETLGFAPNGRVKTGFEAAEVCYEKTL